MIGVLGVKAKTKEEQEVRVINKDVAFIISQIEKGLSIPEKRGQNTH